MNVCSRRNKLSSTQIGRVTVLASHQRETSGPNPSGSKEPPPDHSGRKLRIKKCKFVIYLKCLASEFYLEL